MPDKYHALRSILVASLFLGIAAGGTSSTELALREQTLQAIEACITRSPAPWPDEWKREYIETIRSAFELHTAATQYAVRLEILRKGFGPYWENLKKSRERSLFEVTRAQIRWYAEHLMGAELPDEDERQKLRDQYGDLWDHAAGSLLAQFPFLDPNAVRAAKADHLSQCYRKIAAPLMPVYLRPFSEEQVERIKQRWGDLRYARVDLWRQLGGDSTTSTEDRNVPPSNSERDYQLTQRSLDQLLAYIWPIVAPAPDYYRSAFENRGDALQRRLQSMRKAASDERRLEKERSRQFLQTEHISFLLAALLETPRCLDRSPSMREQEAGPLAPQGRTAKGGGAYDLKNDSPEK